jgi:hypothetical protein
MRPAPFLIAVFIGAGFPAYGAELPDPIAPAARGQLQCYMPDKTRKTCNSLAGYRPNPSGGIDNIATVLLSKNPVLTMQTVSPVEIKMGQVCGRIRRQDLAIARFTVGGRPADEQQAAQLRAQLEMAFQNVFDHEVCTGYVDQGGMLIAKATIDGVPAPPSADQPVLWVSPSDGYSVGP